MTATAAMAPFALCVLVPRSRGRDVATCVLQMWAYVATYQMPNDDPEALERRVRVAYPVRVDRALGLGTTPTLRLQRALGTPGGFRTWEKVLVWSHWLWFLFPHGTVAYLLLRHPERFPRGAAQIYATFDLGLIGYWAVPTAPPWYAAEPGPDGRRAHARAAPDDGRVRRAVLEVRLGAAVRFPRRQPTRCHAVTALRHLGDGRARARRQPSRRRGAGLDIRGHARHGAACTWASTT